jgi:hypothetical protein
MSILSVSKGNVPGNRENIPRCASSPRPWMSTTSPGITGFECFCLQRSALSGRKKKFLAVGIGANIEIALELGSIVGPDAVALLDLGNHALHSGGRLVLCVGGDDDDGEEAERDLTRGFR